MVWYELRIADSRFTPARCRGRERRPVPHLAAVGGEELAYPNEKAPEVGGFSLLAL
jgi:hypothetical protein